MRARTILPCWALLLTVVGSVPAWSQSASQITPPTFRPSPSAPGTAVIVSGQPGLNAPAGADRLFVKLSGVTVEGGRPELAGDVEALRARLVGRRVPASELFAAARDLEAAYARAGFVLVRVVLPAQSLRDGGRMRLTVVDGFVERLEVGELPERVRARVTAVLSPLVGQKGLRLGEIERRLMIAGDTPGVAMRSALTPGKEAGATVLVVQGTYKMVGGFVGFDNTLSTDLGRVTANAGLDLNTPFGFGETIYLRASGHPGGNDSSGVGAFFSDLPRVRTLAGGIVVPLGVDGLTLNLEATNSRTTPKAKGGLQTATEFERYSTRLRYPWIRSRGLTFASEVIFDVEEERDDARLVGVVLPLALDRLRVLRLASDVSWQVPGAGTLFARGIASFGLDAFGARSAADATPILPLTRQGADADFAKAEAIVSYAQALGEHVGIGLLARGQTAFNSALPRAEQLGIASFQELSTFDAGTLGGDSGWMVRGEVNSPWLLPAGPVQLSVMPYAFAATGALSLHRPTVFERGTTNVSSIGVGLRLAASPDAGVSQASLTVEFGRRYRDDGLPDANRFTVVGSLKF